MLAVFAASSELETEMNARTAQVRTDTMLLVHGVFSCPPEPQEGSWGLQAPTVSGPRSVLSSVGWGRTGECNVPELTGHFKVLFLYSVFGYHMLLAVFWSSDIFFLFLNVSAGRGRLERPSPLL